MIPNPPCWGPAGILTMGFGSVSCWEPGRSPGVAGAGWHRAPLRGGGIYHPAAAAGSAPGLFSLSLAHRSSATGFHGLHTTNKLTHMLACAQTHVWTRTHMGTSPCTPAARRAPRSRAHAQISRAWQHFARWHAILLLHVCTRRRSPKFAHAGATSRFHPSHVRGAHRPARARRCARRSLPCPAVLKSWSSSWLPLGPLVPAVPSHGDLSATCPRAARSLPVPPKPHAGCCTEPGGSRRAPRPRKLCTARGLSGGARSCSSAAKGWGDVQAGVEASCVP